MYAVSTEDLEEAIQALEDASKYPKHTERVKKFLNRKEEWVKLFRFDIIHRGHETNNYAEASIRILKDIILTRTKAFNVVALVEFIVDPWETYFKTRLMHNAYGQNAAPRLKYQSLCQRMPESKLITAAFYKNFLKQSKKNKTMFCFVKVWHRALKSLRKEYIMCPVPHLVT